MGIFPDAQGQLTPQSIFRSGRNSNSFEMLWFFSLPERMKKFRSQMKVLVFTTLYINFSEGHITLESVVVSGRNLNSSKLSCMYLLPARIRMIESKMKELECSQDFSHYKSMTIFPDAQWQLTPQFVVRSGRISNLSEML